MIKRTLYFANAAHLHTKKSQLIVRYPHVPDEKSVPIEDIGILLLEHPQISISHTLISRLLANNAAIITCDHTHMPQGLMLNLNAHTLQQKHFRIQLNATEAQHGRLWQQTIKHKINNQASLLESNGIAAENMRRWASKVQSADPDNYEARAAAYYWKKLFDDHLNAFKRGRFEGAPNNLLNYGYAILRATIARSLMGSGLLLTVGYHHNNQYNAYCLADDVMEPYRPIVDQLVLELVRSIDDYTTLTPAIKQKLLQIPTLDTNINNQRSPLMLATQETSSSLLKCYARELKKIKFPLL